MRSEHAVRGPWQHAVMEITAAVLRTPEGPYTLEPIHLDEPGPGQVLVRIVGTGLCHTDQLPRAMGVLCPLITGHEGAGVVEAVGPEVTGIAVGDHVVCSYDSCGACNQCRAGRPWSCDTFLVRNLTGRNPDWSTGARDGDGAEVGSRWFGQSSFATHSVVAARNTVQVDPALPLEKLGPLGCGLLTGAGSVLEALEVASGESLVVFGAGAVGLAAVMAAAAVGASPIVAVDLHPERLELATELGATAAVVGGTDATLASVMEAVGGGADFSFDTTGVPEVILDAFRILRLGGHAGLVGIQSGDLTLDPGILVGKQVSNILEGNADPQVTIPRLIEWWGEGRFPFDRLVQTYPLDAIDEAEAASLSGEVVKPVLLPGA